MLHDHKLSWLNCKLSWRTLALALLFSAKNISYSITIKDHEQTIKKTQFSTINPLFFKEDILITNSSTSVVTHYSQQETILILNWKGQEPSWLNCTLSWPVVALLFCSSLQNRFHATTKDDHLLTEMSWSPGTNEVFTVENCVSFIWFLT